jgi:hypothetical protein
MRFTENLTTEDLSRPGPETLGTLLIDWFGPRRPSYGIPQTDMKDVLLPSQLRAFYSLAGRWPGLFKQNRLLIPAQLRAEGDRLVFYVENQGVYLWATLPDGKDPPVWIQENAPGMPWEIEDGSLSYFLLQAVLFEAAIGAAEGARAVGLEMEFVRRVMEPLAHIELPPWHWPAYPTSFYAAESLIAVTNPDPPGSDIVIGARRPEPIQYLDAIVNKDWPWFSLRDGQR